MENHAGKGVRNQEALRLCFIAPVPPPYGGIANWLNLICSFMENSRKAMEYTIINTAPHKRITEGRNLWDKIFVSGIDILRKRKELISLIKEKQIDVIHMTTSGQLAIIRDLVMLKTANRNGIPTVYHIHMGRTGQIIEGKSFEKHLLIWALKLASAIVILDQNSYIKLKKKWPEINAFNVPNPIDMYQMPKPVQTTKKDIVFLGWNIRSKGVEELIIAWNNTGKMFPDYCLKLIGPIREQYRLYLNSLIKVDNVIFTGELSHETALGMLNESSIFILPSYTEGFPNVVVEAMALKKPIIATCVGAIPEMLDENRGILIEPKSIEQIEKALKYFLMNMEEAQSMAQRAYIYACENYNIEKVFSEHEKIWNSLRKQQL